MQVKIYLDGLHCPMCVGRVERMLSALQGVESVSVSLDEQCATLYLSEPIETELLKQTVEDLGFDFIRRED